MYSNKEIKEYMNAYKGVKKIAARACIKLSAPLIRILNQEFSLIQNVIDRHERMLISSSQMETRLGKCEMLAETVRQLKEQWKSCEEMSENMKKLNSRLEGYEELAENVRKLNSRLEGYEEQTEMHRQLNIRFEEASVNIRQLNSRLEGYESMAETVRGLHGCEERIAELRNRADRMESLGDMNTVKIARLEKSRTPEKLPDTVEKVEKQENDAPDMNMQDTYSSMDYFDFENHFRGSRNAVKQSQKIYLDYFRDRKHVLDVGCGRGEFLELMKEHGIQGYGVDAYQEFVELCQSKQLEAVYGDAFDILEKERELDGIFAAQFIEHISFEKLVYLLELAYEKLIPGSYLVLETPNPMSLAIYAYAFYIDPSHNKPVHPFTVKYLLEKIGFCDISIIFTESSKPSFTIPKLKIENAGNMESFHAAMGEVERLLFGSQDYAVVARR